MTGVYDDDDVISGTIDNQIDLPLLITNGEGVAVLTGVYCLRNAGDDPALLTATLLARSSVEIGDCRGTESVSETAIGAVGCGEGDEGELDVTVISLSSVSIDEGSCPAGGEFSPTSEPGDTTLLSDMAPGETCRIQVFLSADALEQGVDPIIAAVTDSLSFDLAFNLTEPFPD